MTTERPQRPVMRWHGGKFILAPWIVSHFPPHRVYVEPYGGAASVLFAKAPAFGEVLNDLDGEVVNLFSVLRDEAQASRLSWLLERTPFARAEFEASYEPASDPVEQARRTIVRAFMGIGVSEFFRERATGFRASINWNTNPARYWATYPESVAAFTARLRGEVIERRPAIEVMVQNDAPYTLHYVDPPYPVDTRKGKQRYRHEMTEEDHHALAAVLRSLLGMVVLSGYPCPLYAGLYGDWVCVTETVRDAANEWRTEALWLNPAASCALAECQPSLFEEGY